MTFLRINNTDLPNPSTYQVQQSDLDGTGTSRSITGNLYRNCIRKNLVKILISWENLPYGDVATIMNSINSESFTVEYYDGTDTLKTIKGYTGDRSLSTVSVNPNNITDSRWNLSFNIIAY
jgi:hypothetical protein